MSELIVCGTPAGREEVSARVIESCLSHSETIIVYLCLHSLWAGAFSIEDEGVQGRAREGWVGPPKGLIAVGLRGSSSKFHWNLNWEWWVKLKWHGGSLNHPKGNTEGTTKRTCASLRPRIPISVERLGQQTKMTNSSDTTDILPMISHLMDNNIDTPRNSNLELLSQ